MSDSGSAPSGEMSIIYLDAGERIVAVVPEECRGPGWSNRVVWVHIEDSMGGHRTECLQPLDQTPEMWALFEAGAAMHRALLAAVPLKTRRQK